MIGWRLRRCDDRSVDTPSLTSLATAILYVPSPERALVIGCGEGESVLLLAREFPAARVRGVDASPEAVQRATGRVGLDPEGRVAFKVGKRRALPYPDEMFDLVVQAQGALWPKEVVRVLRPGGCLVYLESVRWPLRPRPRSLRRGLARLGFEQRWVDATGGHTVYVGRLRADRKPLRE